MSTLKKFFPLAFKHTKDVADLIIGIIIQIIIGAIAGVLIWLATAVTAWIPVVGIIIALVLGIASSLVGLYIFISIVIQILAFCKVLKD